MREFPALDVTSRWVEQTLVGLTLDQKIGQLLHPNVWPFDQPEELDQILGEVGPGGLFLHPGQTEAFKRTTQWLQERARRPLLVSADLENGAGNVMQDATTFPNLMSLAATNTGDQRLFARS